MTFSGVIERRLPNGLIEQTDIEGRVTFFQAAPPKANNSGMLHPIPPVTVLKNDLMDEPNVNFYAASTSTPDIP